MAWPEARPLRFRPADPMRPETLDRSYDLDAVLEEIERAVQVADDSGYEDAIAAAHETLERQTLLQRLKGTAAALRAWLF